MKQKLYKISFPDKSGWEAFKAANLLDEEGKMKSEFTVAGEGYLPKAPAADWTPKDAEDNGWSVYPDYSVDIISKKATKIFDKYLIAKPANPLRSVAGGNFEIVYK